MVWQCGVTRNREEANATGVGVLVAVVTAAAVRLFGIADGVQVRRGDLGYAARIGEARGLQCRTSDVESSSTLVR